MSRTRKVSIRDVPVQVWAKLKLYAVRNSIPMAEVIVRLAKLLDKKN